jgi:hypothetical protein
MELYTLRSWIPIEKLNVTYFNLKFSQHAVDYLKNNPEYIKWDLLYTNPYAMDLIREKIQTEKNNDYIEYLCQNPNPEAVDIIEKYIITQKEILPALMEEYNNQLEEDLDDDWSENSYPEDPEENFRYSLYYLCQNPKAVPLLRKYPEFIDKSRMLRYNNSKEALELLAECGVDLDREFNKLGSNPYAIEILKKHFQEINFNNICSNPECIFMLLANQHLINWELFSSNTSPFAINLMKKNLHRVNWCALSTNPSAIYLLEKYPNYVNYRYISQNPKIFVINPKAIFKWVLTKKQIRQFGWEYPKVYLILRLFVDIISEAIYNPGYKWCQKLETKRFKELIN